MKNLFIEKLKNFLFFQDIFTQLDEFRAFELLRSGLDRTRYLCVKEAKIIAMTCTHAALKRKELVTMGFKYDNILMEESAQVSDVWNIFILTLVIDLIYQLFYTRVETEL